MRARLSLPDKNSVADQFLQVPDQHALGDFRNAAAQFAGTHRPIRKTPEDGSLPSSVNDRQHRVDRAFGDFFF